MSWSNPDSGLWRQKENRNSSIRHPILYAAQAPTTFFVKWLFDRLTHNNTYYGYTKPLFLLYKASFPLGKTLTRLFRRNKSSFYPLLNRHLKRRLYVATRPFHTLYMWSSFKEELAGVSHSFWAFSIRWEKA
jgi:hypothetical protein